LDYFNEEENDHNDSDDNSDANDDEPDISQHAPERHIFSIGCSDDNGSLAELDNKEISAVKEFTKTQCCSLKCSEIFPKEVIIRSRINSQQIRTHKLSTCVSVRQHEQLPCYRSRYTEGMQ